MAVTQPRAWGAFSGSPYGSFAGRAAYSLPVPVVRYENWFFRPSNVPETYSADWMRQEMQSISKASFGAAPYLQFQPLGAAPEKPRIGLEVYADGTNWDPGSGEGKYVYKSTGWALLG